MSKESEKDLLLKIQQTLEDIKAILLFANQNIIADTKKNLLKDGSLEQQVYEMCDGTNTNQDIANALKKPEKTIRATISTLRRKGLIKTTQQDGRKMHEQIL
jgi:biotin operon repressor